MSKVQHKITFNKKFILLNTTIYFPQSLSPNYNDMLKTTNILFLVQHKPIPC